MWKNKRKTQSERDSKILQRYRDGASLQEIGTEFGINPIRIHTIVNREGTFQTEEMCRRMELRYGDFYASPEKCWVMKYIVRTLCFHFHKMDRKLTPAQIYDRITGLNDHDFLQSDSTFTETTLPFFWAIRADLKQEHVRAQMIGE